MNEHDAPVTDEQPEQPPELPPIPDGGLATGLPSWLAAPPARPSKLAGEPEPLDLQTLAGSAAVPHWLEDLSNRVDRDAGVLPPDEVIPIEESPVETQVAVVDESPVEDESGQVAAIVPAAVTERVEPVVVSEPRNEIVASEPRSKLNYLLIALAVVVVAALAAWLMWG